MGRGEGLVGLHTTNEVEVLKISICKQGQMALAIKKGWDFFRQL